MRLIARAHLPDKPEIESVMILGLTVGVLLIRYFSFAKDDIEGDHWFDSPEEAKAAAEQEYGVRPDEWLESPDTKDRLYELSAMPINGQTYNPETGEWEQLNCGDYSPKS